MSAAHISFAQPSWNTPTSVSEAITRTFASASQAQAVAAHEAILNAVANNHAGTYYPIALPVVAELCQALPSASPWAQFAAVEALVDLCGSFEPEPEHAIINSPTSGLPIALREALVAQVALSRPTLSTIVGAGGPAAASATSLLAVIE